jgi:4a-hydroxytetrahydrobiopterin dehydratase
MSSELTAKVCVPCRGGVPPLSRAEAEPYLGQIPDWRLSEDASRIARAFSFRNFAEALDFVNRVGALAEDEGHHPDIAFGWGHARITLFTHKIKGLHQNDFIMAAKTDALAR